MYQKLFVNHSILYLKTYILKVLLLMILTQIVGIFFTQIFQRYMLNPFFNTFYVQ